MEVLDQVDEVAQNRADLSFSDGDFEAAVRDRTEVLALRSTSHNRRYIARIRRSRALWKLDRRSDALQDIAAILETSDIVPEQKMSARLQRAKFYLDQDETELAKHDLDAVIASTRNFKEILDEAASIRAEL